MALDIAEDTAILVERALDAHRAANAPRGRR